MLERFDNVQVIREVTVKFLFQPRQRVLLKIGQRGTVVTANGDMTCNVQLEDLPAQVVIPSISLRKINLHDAPLCVE